ncbi:lytic transglycosylase, partial [Pseudoxanthomonas sp. SGD-10]
MKKAFALIFYCFLVIGTYAQNNKVKTDTAYISRLTPKESRVIRNLVSTDSSFVPTQINLQTELLKYDANLVYKYRLDSIKSEIPLDYNVYVQSFIDAFINRTAQIGRMISLGNYYFPIFEKALQQYKVPEAFKYLPIVESAMDPHAVSRVGATGLWQFMYTTGKGYGLTIDNYIDERKDPISSSFAASAYLRNAYNELGDWLLAMASYNCGIGAVKRALVRAGGEDKDFWEIKHLLPRETQNYVPKFIAVVYMMHYFDRHNDREIPEMDFRIDIDSIYVNRMVSFDSLADVLDIERKELQILNPAYKKA